MGNEHFCASREWRELRFAVLLEFGRKCMCCNATSKPLHVDHIKPISKYPELRLTKSNLQVLCEDCNLGKSNKHESDFRKLKPKTRLIKKQQIEVVSRISVERKSLDEINGQDGFVLTKRKHREHHKIIWHLWQKDNTACRMFNPRSGLEPSYREFSTEMADRTICRTCVHNFMSRNKKPFQIPFTGLV